MGLKERMDAVVKRAVDAAAKLREQAAKTVSENTESAVENVKNTNSTVVYTATTAVDAGKTAWQMPKNKTLQLIEDAVKATQKAREDAQVLAIERAEEAAKAAELAAKESKGLVDGVISFLGGLLADGAKNLLYNVIGLVKGAKDTVNWLTDAVANPPTFLDWLKSIVLAAW